MPAKPVIGFHLDLKGMNHRFPYVLRMLGDLADQGVNTVLVEYEDVFPFRGLDIASDRSVVWTRRQHTQFLAQAAKLGLEIIPLQQCMGHLEYVLGWERYRHLAEDKRYPSTINVSNPQAVALIKNMLTQVIEAHPDSRLIHLGMDEAHALKLAAKRLGRDVLDVFLEHLRSLLPIVESAGKTAYIWTDMLEDHFRPDAFRDFAGGRVIFGIWDYTQTAGDYLPAARLRGGEGSVVRVSRQWLDDPGDPQAPPISAGSAFTEDWPANIQRLAKPYRKGRLFLRNFYADMWTKLGMKCLPVSALRLSGHGATVLPYHAAARNVLGWSQTYRRTHTMGQIGTSWARGTSWCPPNAPQEMIWPLVGILTRSMGAKPKPFWPGIPQKTIDRLIMTLGRSCEDWRLEGKVAAEMEKLAPRVRGHRYEWDSIALMARVLELNRRAEHAVLEVEFFHANARPAPPEWERRLRDQRGVLRDLRAMRRKVARHFGQRYHGRAFEEWVSHVFDLNLRKMLQYQRESREKLARSRKFYAGRA